MPAHRRALAVLLLVLAVAVAGCGDDDAASSPEDVSGEGPAGEGPPAEWEEATLAIERGADTLLLTAVDGDQIVMLTASDDGVVRSAVATGDGSFETGLPLDTGSEHLMLGGLARYDGAWWAAGSGGTQAVPSRPDDWELSMDLHVVTSTDGLTWTEVDATGFDGPGHVSAVVATDDGLAAVGHDEGANVVGDGSFTPLAWHSADGQAWEVVELPGIGDEDSVTDLIAVGDELLAVGHVGGVAAQWRSADGGASWTDEEPDGVPPGSTLGTVVTLGETLLASGAGPPTEETEGGSPPLTFRSSDGGRSWTEGTAPEVTEPEGNGAPIAAVGDRALALVSSFFEPMSDPAACYADIEQCRGDTDVAVYEGDGTGPWTRIDLSGLSLDEYAEVDGVVATADRLVLWSATGEQEITTWSTPADATLPTQEEPTRETADIRLLDVGEEPEVGVEYAAPLYIHCGMDWLYLGDEPWERTDDGADVETGAGEATSEDWPTAGQTIYGYATLVDADTVEYSIGDGEVIATYGRPTRDPEMCM